MPLRLRQMTCSKQRKRCRCRLSKRSRGGHRSPPCPYAPSPGLRARRPASVHRYCCCPPWVRARERVHRRASWPPRAACAVRPECARPRWVAPSSASSRPPAGAGNTPPQLPTRTTPRSPRARRSPRRWVSWARDRPCSPPRDEPGRIESDCPTASAPVV
ncbi:hypothetical protein T492DRAFT_1006063 [Pavlovales sp. CCMP2436]|nr:hypothetical protein T492DRAFT_1006063 [Pavlovales sp. CCMP2436]